MSAKEALKCQILIIGENGVGKKSIIERYIYNAFSYRPIFSQAFFFVEKKIFLEEFNQTIRFLFFNPEGQGKYKAFPKGFYKNADACVMVYDIMRNSSFEKLKNYWVKEVKANGSPNI